MTPFQFIRIQKKLIAHSFNVLLLFGLVAQVGTVSALTGGPSQPEVQSFQPSGVDNLVDPFTGDFSYNIPLLDIEGYPLNLSYSSGIGMEDEASWVGLGWNLSPGVVNRTVRGLPDDFDGDIVTKEMNVKKNVTLGLSGKLGKEFIGLKRKNGKTIFPNADPKIQTSLSIGLNYNTYNGVNAEIASGFGMSINPSLNKKNKMEDKFSLDITNSSDGLTVAPSYSLPAGNGPFTIGTSFNTHSGINSMQLGLQEIAKDLGVSASIPFGLQSYTPTIDMPMNLVSISLGAKGGHEIKFKGITANLDGYYSSQSLANKVRKLPALGYMNSHNAHKYDNGYGIVAMMDVNRENDGSFNPNTPLLPVAYQMYDMFSVTSHGVSGSFRAFRNDMGYMTDPYVNSHSGGGHGNLDISIGDLSKAGVDVGVNFAENISGYWHTDTRLKYLLNYQTSDPYQDYEPYYFKKIGEPAYDSEADFRSNYGDEKAVRPQIVGEGFSATQSGKIVDADGNVTTVTRNNSYRKNKMPRGILFKTIQRDELYRESLQNFQDIMHPAPGHHIGEVVTITEGGTEYHFGIPAYNTTKEETTFNVGEDNHWMMNAKIDKETGFVRYQNSSNSTDNEKGSDNFYSNTITPAYAHSYLLTSIVSSDYVDSDLIPGPSDNDLGTYTRFDYKKLDKPFRWRTPYQANYANHNEGLKSDPGDDKAMVTYGEKEIWYLDKIETKNLVAVFTTEERDDAHEVTDKNGGYSPDNQSMHLLRKIELYAKKDFKDNYGAGTAIPIKVVHFEYDYSLCPGVPNNPTGGGKLTLKKVYFTYGTSDKSAHNAYTFTYGNNPGYQNMGNDMWGSFKPNDNPKPKLTDPTKSNTEFPYTNQDKPTTDAHVMAWSLTNITLPNSGNIAVTYESDDYAFVQDKRAMELFEVVGATSTKPTPTSNVTADIGELFSGPLGAKVEHLYLIIKLKEDIPNNPDAFDYFRDRYLHNIGENVFFKFMMNVKSSGDPYWENVEGYMDVEDDITNTNHFSLLNVGGGDYNHAFIKIKTVDIGDWEGSQNVNPIAKAAWQYGRMNMSKYLNQNFDPEDGGIEQNMKKLVSTNIFKNLYATIVGPNRIYRDQNFGKEFLTNRSYIRLGEPTRAKLGGGLRVKQIVMSDNWNTMVNQPGYVTSYYGKEYDYTTLDDVTGKTISSGVAASEPSTAGGESPLITPIFSKDVKKKVLAPDDRFYVTTPVGKAIFPSPQVGYSKVTITDLTIGNPVGSTVTRHATGKTIKEFYTARDFPVIVEMTGLDLELARNIPKTGLFLSYSRDFATASQGFTIQLNDMHGKPKAEWVYEEGKEDPISGSEYTYKLENYGESSFKLTNTADVLLPDGSVTSGQIGVETDVTLDLRQYYAGSTSGSVQVNFESTTAGAVPLILGTVWPDLGIDETRFRSATISKVISRYGLIEKVTAYDLGSSIDTENLAYDSETGGVLLTRTQNEFEDNLFSLSLPAYWYYDLMGPAYKSDNLISTAVVVDGSGYASIEDADQRYVRGDIVIASNGMLGWVTEVNQSTIKLITEAGVKFPATSPTTDLKTVRSGRRNLQAGMMGSITTKQNPLHSFGKNSYPEVLSASVQLYKEGWGTWCDCFTSSSFFRITDNDYLTAQKGIYRPYKSLTYLTGRTQSMLNNNTNIRVDGEFKAFNPYWVFTDKGITVDDANWTWVQEATIFSPSGTELENMDALSRYSSALYGYNHALPIAVSKNSQYREIGFDNFEDYEYESCDDDHFSWRDFTSDVQSQESHTGKYSIKVDAGSSKVITKNVEVCP